MRDDRPRVWWNSVGLRPNALVVVGQTNPYGADPHFALYTRPQNATGARLYYIVRQALGEAKQPVMSEWEWLKVAERINLCTGEFRDTEARAAAARVVRERRDRPVLLLGKRVADAFAALLPEPALYEGREGVYLIPHPSGRNRAWNHPSAYQAAATCVAKAIAQAFGQAVETDRVQETQMRLWWKDQDR